MSRGLIGGSETYISYTSVARLIEQDEEELQPDLGIDESLADLIPLYLAVEDALQGLVQILHRTHWRVAPSGSAFLCR